MLKDTDWDALIIDRVISESLGQLSSEFRHEILPDTTPVPVFGDYRISQVATIALNPSSKEFPKKKESRRLMHLSDLGLSAEHYRQGLKTMSKEQATKILEKCANYFELNSYRWFDTASKALKLGFDASFYKKDQTKFRACHVDLFPWATRAYSDLSLSIRQGFKKENRSFLNWFLARDQITNIVILGNSTWRELNNEFEIHKIQEEKPVISSPPTFETGLINISGHMKPYFYNSKGPSARGDNARKYLIHELFGQFIKQYNV